MSKDTLIRSLITKIVQEGKVPELRFEDEFYEDYSKLMQKIKSRKSNLPSLEYLEKTYGFEREETDQNVDDLIEQINKIYFRESAVKALGKFKQDALKNDDYLSVLSDLQKNFTSIRGALTKTFVCDVTNDVDAVMDERKRDRERGSLINLGFETYDIVSGTKTGDLVFVCGPTGRGKTTTMLKSLDNSIKNGYDSLFFSLEMSLVEVTNRLIAMQGKYTYTDLKYDKIGDKEYREEVEKLKKTPAKIITRSNEGRIDLATVERYIQEYGPKIVYIDYLTLLDDVSFNWDASPSPTKELKRMAGCYHCVIVVGLQADTATMGNDDIPDIVNIRGNKGWAFDCNTFIGVTSIRQKNDEADKDHTIWLKMIYKVGKHRDGKCPAFAYKVAPDKGEWYDITDEYEFDL